MLAVLLGAHLGGVAEFRRLVERLFKLENRGVGLHMGAVSSGHRHRGYRLVVIAAGQTCRGQYKRRYI